MALHTRGVNPDPGIGQKAKWYAKGEGGTSFFRPTKSSDLVPGASLFFARWEDNPPKDAVQIIRASLYPDLRTDTNETIHDGLKDSNGCTYHIGGDGLISRDCPAASTIDPSVSPPVRTQWLNWYHEAIVVEVDEKHGRVVTFETGPIGIRNTRPLKDVQYGVLDHWDVYAGFAPSTAAPKDIDRYLKDILPGR